VRPSRDEIRAQLEALSPPEPRPEFTARLEARLRAVDLRVGDLEGDPGVRRWRAGPGFLALGAVAAIAIVLFALLPEQSGSRVGVTGTPPAAQPEGGAATPVEPSASTTTTLASGPATSVPGRTGGAGPTATVAPGDRSGPSPGVPVLPAGPGTTIAATPTTRVRTEPTTTTRPPEPETLALACVAGQPEGQPGVQCDWSQSTAPSFAAYRVWRATGTEAKQVLTTIPVRTITRYVDRPGAGVQHYMVEALDAQNRVVGRSAIVEAVCC
jgi:hypothetical protein